MKDTPPLQQVFSAIEKGSVSEVEQLLTSHPDLAVKSGSHMLEDAAENNRVDLLPIIVASGVDVNAGGLRHTPLGTAVCKGATEAAQWLLEHGADINGRPQANGCTPLHYAIQDGRLDAVKFLLNNGADPNAMCGYPEKNAVAVAKLFGHAEIAAYLEEQGFSEIVIEPVLVDVESAKFMARDTSLTPTEWFEKKWWHVYAYANRHGLDALCERNQVLFLVGYLIDQMCDGGAPMVYCNPSAEYTPQMVQALAKLGARDAAKLIHEINELFPGGKPAVDWEAREHQINDLPKHASKLGAELERIFDKRSGGQPLLLIQLIDYYHA